MFSTLVCSMDTIYSILSPLKPTILPSVPMIALYTPAYKEKCGNKVSYQRKQHICKTRQLRATELYFKKTNNLITMPNAPTVYLIISYLWWRVCLFFSPSSLPLVPRASRSLTTKAPVVQVG